MSLMKAPKIERRHLLALKTLLRLDYARAIRNRMEAVQKDPNQHPALATLAVLTLTDALMEADQPISITQSLMEMHGATAAWMPLTDERFAFYSKVLGIDVSADDFKGTEPAKLEAILAPLRALQTELRKLFEEADSVDPAELFRKPGKGISGSAPTKSMMN